MTGRVAVGSTVVKLVVCIGSVGAVVGWVVGRVLGDVIVWLVGVVAAGDAVV